MRQVFLFLLSVLLCTTVQADDTAIQPVNNAVLHYRLIGFTFPENTNATAYKLEIFEATSASKPILTLVQNTNKIIAIVPAFGKQYSWRVQYLKKKKVITTSPTYQFSTADNHNEKTSRVVIIDSAKKYKDLLLFFDNTRTLYNMAGEALWYLPVIKGITDSTCGKIRDLKMTAIGTITFMTEKNVHEIDYNGNVLWSAPNDGRISGDTSEQFHHEITRSSNGNYMVIANKMVAEETTNNNMGKGNSPKLPCGTIVEYNSKNEVVWTWNSCDYLKMSDPTTHFNSFYLDEKNKVFYTSYRNISRVVKAAYPSGNIIAQYGEDEAKKGSIKGDGLFYAQHNLGINGNGNLHMFNNNFKMSSVGREGNDSRVSTVAVFKEPVTIGDSLQMIWEFSCDIDTLAKAISSGGGSVYELDNGDYLVCMGLPARNFIVSKDKQVLWNVITEQYEGIWKHFAGYRISAVKPDDRVRLLFR